MGGKKNDKKKGKDKKEKETKVTFEKLKAWPKEDLLKEGIIAIENMTVVGKIVGEIYNRAYY